MGLALFRHPSSTGFGVILRAGLLAILPLVLLLAVFGVDRVQAQGTATSTATQNVSLQVRKLARLTVTGTPSLDIDEVTGTTLEQVTDASSTYTRVNNYDNAKVTASIDQALGSGYTLETQFGTDAGSWVDVSTATTTAVNVLSNIARGTTLSGTLSYRFSATVAAGELAATTRTVTYTITDA